MQDVPGADLTHWVVTFCRTWRCRMRHWGWLDLDLLDRGFHGNDVAALLLGCVCLLFFSLLFN